MCRSSLFSSVCCQYGSFCQYTSKWIIYSPEHRVKDAVHRLLLRGGGFIKAWENNPDDVTVLSSFSLRLEKNSASKTGGVELKRCGCLPARDGLMKDDIQLHYGDCRSQSICSLTHTRSACAYVGILAYCDVISWSIFKYLISLKPAQPKIKKKLYKSINQNNW